MGTKCRKSSIFGLGNSGGGGGGISINRLHGHDRPCSLQYSVIALHPRESKLRPGSLVRAENSTGSAVSTAQPYGAMSRRSWRKQGLEVDLRSKQRSGMLQKKQK